MNNLPKEWEIKRFDELFERLTTKNTENNSNVLTISAQEGLIAQDQFFNKIVASDNKSNYFLLRKGDFAYNKSYSKGYPFGAFKRLKRYEKGVVSPLYICFSPKTTTIPEFYEHYFESGYFNMEINSIAQEGARNHGLLNISIGDFLNTKLIYPTISEQKMIAELLSTWDETILKCKEIIINLESYMKSCIKLFTKPTNRINSHTEWTKYTLRDILIEENEKTTFNNQFEILTSTIDNIYLQSDYFNRQIASKDNVGYKILKKNRLVMSPQNAWMGNINVNTDFDIGIVSPSYKIYILNGVNELYFKYFVKSELFRKLIENYSQAGASIVRKSLNLEGLLLTKIDLPSVDKQRKLGLFFQEIDRKINTYSKLKDSYEIQKKGLMQQLLTGKIRVNIN